MQARILPLSDALAEDLAAKRRWLLGHYAPGAEGQYDTVAGKLDLLDTILSNGWVHASETLKLQCLGVAFGDAMSQELGMQWVQIEDDYGCDPALTIEGTTIQAFPLTTISKRVEAGAIVNVYALFSSACATVRRIREGDA